ncbi:MAG TPA: tetratricopeptide repeat protein [Streptosporangiaceae bacterium]
MARYRPPDYLPSEVLARPDFVAACKRRDLGKILAIARKYGGPGFTVSHLARRCEMTINQVQDYIKRGRQAQSLDIFERVADGLHIPGAMLGMTHRLWEGQLADQKSDDTAPNATTSVTQAGKPSTDANPILPEQERIRAASDLESGEGADIMLMLQEADRTDIGSGTIESLYTIFDKLCRDYVSSPAPELQQGLKRLYARIMRLRQGPMTFGQHKELIALSGWATALLACVDWDMNEREAAETARAATLRFAKEIDHPELMAWSYEIQAWFALTEGRYSDVTSIAKAAQSIGGENPAIVQLIMQEARGWAKLGNREAFELAIERAHDLLQKLPAIYYPRHFVWDSTKFPFYVATCYQWLGEYDKAEEYAMQVLKECEANGTTARSPMRLAEVYIILGLVHAHRGDLEAAVNSGLRALTYERKSGPSLFIRAAELNATMAERFPGAPQYPQLRVASV